MGFGSTIAAQSNNPETKGVNIPLIKATVTVTNSCKKGRSCGSWSFSMTKVNAITITNLSTTWYPSLEYTIYTGPNLTGTQLPSFVCNQSPMTFASTLLTNGGTFSVKLKDPNSSNSTYYNFTNGSFNGQKCTPTPVSATDKL